MYLDSNRNRLGIVRTDCSGVYITTDAIIQRGGGGAGREKAEYAFTRGNIIYLQRGYITTATADDDDDDNSAAASRKSESVTAAYDVYKRPRQWR